MPIDHEVLSCEHVERDSDEHKLESLLYFTLLTVSPVQVKPVQAILDSPGKRVVGPDLAKSCSIFLCCWSSSLTADYWSSSLTADC